MKLTLPFMSASASGKFANSIVGFGWKGINVARRYVIPSNPMSADQGTIRTILGGLGRAVGMAVGLRSNPTDLRDLFLSEITVPEKQTIQSYVVAQIRALYASDQSAYESLYSEYAGHTHKTAFDTSAAAAGLTDFFLPYAGTSDHFTAGLQLYVLAKYGIQIGLSSAPFATALASWNTTQTDGLVALM